MKKLLLSILVAAGTVGFATAETATYNVNDADNIKGTEVEETYKSDGSVQAARHYQPLESFMLDEYAFTFDAGTNETNAPAYYYATSTNTNKQTTVRLYVGNSCTITAPDGVNMTKIEFKGSNAGSGLTLDASAGTMTLSGNNATWTGSANSFTFSVNATWRFTELTITTGEDGDSGETGTTNVLWSDLKENSTECDFVLDHGTLPEGLSYIWSWKAYNGSHYLNASAYANGTAYDSEAYAISPVINLTEATGDITIEFYHAAKFQTTLKDLCKLLVREEGATEWTTLTIPAWPVADTWDFASSGEIDLAAYAGKKIQIAFKYGSTAADGADTWEIKNVVIKGEGKGETPTPDPTPENASFEKATSITSGEQYIFTIGNQYGAPIAATATYGRLNLTNGTVEGDVFKAPAEAAITITSVEGKGYTLVDAENRYMGMDSEHLTTFQLYTEVNDGCYYTATFDGDKVTFTNTLTECIVCQSGTYTNIAPAVVADNQTLPVLYKKAENSGVASIITDCDAAPVYYNLQGVQVANPSNGIYILRQGNKVSKVLVK